MDPTRLQTLDRGLTALSLIAESPDGTTVATVAERLGVHRAIAYRIVATLADHAMIHRDPGGRLRLGSRPLALAAQFDAGLRSLARPIIERLSAETSATAFLSVAVGDECVAIATAEADRPFVNVGYRPGRRHPLTRGAAGIAILAGRPAGPDDPEDVRQARRDGYCVTRGQLQAGAVGVASWVRLSTDLHPGLEASIGVVAMEDLDVARAREATLASADVLSRLMQAKTP
jgi:DNA-binding IclR family transcriptional regulator